MLDYCKTVSCLPCPYNLIGDSADFCFSEVVRFIEDYFWDRYLCEALLLSLYYLAVSYY